LQNIRFDLLKEGDPVEFNVMEESKGLRAVYVVVKEKKE
jgi:cold shock CspA family protein